MHSAKLRYGSKVDDQTGARSAVFTRSDTDTARKQETNLTFYTARSVAGRISWVIGRRRLTLRALQNLRPLVLVIQFTHQFPRSAQSGFGPGISSALMAKRFGRLFCHTWHPTEDAASYVSLATQTLRYGLCSAFGAVGRVADRPRFGAAIDYVA